MELLEFGHGGLPVVVFPTSKGKFYEYEDRGMIGALSDRLESGRLHLFCVDSVDVQSWYNRRVAPWHKIARHDAYESYVLHEVVPLMRRVNDHPRLGVTGCSFGGFHAVDIALRHPDVFQDCVAMGGAYDMRSFVGGYRGEDFYYHQPLMYLKNPDDGWYWNRYQSMRLILATGEHDICLSDNVELSGVLSSRSIPHYLDIWGDATGHDWPWWQRMARKFY
jgi:esterase/lipase superfamily enzyme